MTGRVGFISRTTALMQCRLLPFYVNGRLITLKLQEFSAVGIFCNQSIFLLLISNESGPTMHIVGPDELN